MVASPMTRFQELLLISFREFLVITDEMIVNESKRFRNEIIRNIESFSKRTAVWSLKSLGRFTKEQVGLIYKAIMRRIEFRTFRYFLSYIATWARNEKIVSNGLTRRVQVDKDVVVHELMHRLFSGIPLAEERCTSK
ncbi:hypothetical protein M378DRAFT_794776 [Amanita muscaria Koide BX008]|uniref:Uncharacterized protein n=1 Tax=Amanita muscaria (strain Koide BX008) TaxID=946122 RepID=A0A0C2SGP5_AMAMK|nr:hypothetical protein M378DRAFT_794776 [Amanita muscaria Koide BX008]